MAGGSLFGFNISDSAALATAVKLNTPVVFGAKAFGNGNVVGGNTSSDVGGQAPTSTPSSIAAGAPNTGGSPGVSDGFGGKINLPVADLLGLSGYGLNGGQVQNPQLAAHPAGALPSGSIGPIMLVAALGIASFIYLR